MTNPRVEKAILQSPFSSQLELQTESIKPDVARVRMPWSTARTTVADVVHGGAISALVDSAATAAAWSSVDDPEGYRGTTIGISVSFLSAARATDLTAEARVTRRGSSVCFIEVDVRDAGGEAIASGIVHYKLSRKPSAEETLAGLFAGLSPDEQQTLLARLERSGAALYRAWAEAESDPERRAALLEAARREEQNAEVLER